jgi:Zn-dependent peptidase ImmA (M78 family)
MRAPGHAQNPDQHTSIPSSNRFKLRHSANPQKTRTIEAIFNSFLVLFLSTPSAEEELPIPDLRTRSGKGVSRPSREFIEVINDALLRQDWFREYAQRTGRPRLKFVGRFKRTDPTAEVAADMRAVLRINQSFRQQCHSWEQFLKHLIARVESVGILVMRSGVMRHATRYKLDASEFQGFALSDPYAPVVFINDNDARAAQIFTLAHELVHIWIGETGISNARLAPKSLNELNQLERFCNQVAAEFLVPAQSVTISWQSGKTVHANIQRLGRFFWVSSLVALRRAYDLQKISFSEFQRAIDQEYARLRALEEPACMQSSRPLCGRSSAQLAGSRGRYLRKGRLRWPDCHLRRTWLRA